MCTETSGADISGMLHSFAQIQIDIWHRLPLALRTFLKKFIVGNSAGMMNLFMLCMSEKYLFHFSFERYFGGIKF